MCEGWRTVAGPSCICAAKLASAIWTVTASGTGLAAERATGRYPSEAMALTAPEERLFVLVAVALPRARPAEHDF